MRWLAALLVAGVIAAAAPVPMSAGPRLGTIAVPDDLASALRISLEPWGITVEPLDAPAPAGDGTAVRDAAEDLARDAGVDGLLWVSDDGGAPAMWLFDADSGELSVRPIAATRDPATAAALALAAKTMLRTTVVAPPRERFGAAPPPAPSRLRMIASIGVRRISAGRAEPRLGVGVAWWPAPLRGRAGLALGVISGPGLSIDDDTLLARFTDTTGTAALRARLPLGARLGLDGGAGLSVHATSLDGFSPEHRIAVDVSRVNAAIDLDAALGIALGPQSELALDAGAGIAISRQRYLIGGEPVLELPAVELRLGLELRVHMP
jgi:hypothetical protein